MQKQAKANVPGIRQESQFTCVAASLSASFKALGKEVTEAEVNRVLKAQPLQGAGWEAALAVIQYFGCRGTLVVPATITMLKDWTDRGVPVCIGWNPEGRPWAHASVVYDISEDGNQVWVMDPNCPDPNQTTRIVTKEEFYKRWAEPGENMLVRRPAMAIEREITPDGRQVMASKKTAVTLNMTARLAQRYAEQQNKVAVSPDQWEAAALAIEKGFEGFPLMPVAAAWKALEERLEEERQTLKNQKGIGMGRTGAPDALLGMAELLEELAAAATRAAKSIQQRMS